MAKGVPIGFYFVPFPQQIWDDNLSLSLAEFRLLGYLLRHQISFGNTEVKLTDDELRFGRKRKDGTRMDSGCGIRGINNLKKARDTLAKRGWLEVRSDFSDKARPKHFYRLLIAEGLPPTPPPPEPPAPPVDPAQNGASRVSESDTLVSERGVSDSDSGVSAADKTLSATDTRSVTETSTNSSASEKKTSEGAPPCSEDSFHSPLGQEGSQNDTSESQPPLPREEVGNVSEYSSPLPSGQEDKDPDDYPSAIAQPLPAEGKGETPAVLPAAGTRVPGSNYPATVLFVWQTLKAKRGEAIAITRKVQQRIEALLPGVPTAEVVEVIQAWLDKGYNPYTFGWLDWLEPTQRDARAQARAQAADQQAKAAREQARARQQEAQEAAWQRQAEDAVAAGDMKPEFLARLPKAFRERLEALRARGGEYRQAA